MKKLMIFIFVISFTFANCSASDGWFKVDYGVEHGGPHDIYFYDSNIGWAACGRYILYTSNDGQTWEMQYSDTIAPKGYHFISFVDSLHGWALCEWGESILKTTDGGATWTKSLDWTFDQRRGIQDIAFNPENSKTVFAATSEGIYRSYNLGETWENVYSVVTDCSDFLQLSTTPTSTT